MTGSPPHPQAAGPAPAPRVDDAAPLTTPLLLWLVIQVLALLGPLLRVPLAAKYPQPAELLAIQLLLVVQVTAAGLLFPILLRSAGAAVCIAATSVPLLVLAGVLSATPAGRLTLAGTYVLAWIAALAAWNRVSGPVGRSVGVAAVALLTAGTLAAFYLRLEFAADPAAASATALAANWVPASPPLAALHLLSNGPSARAWCVPALVGALAVTRWIIQRRSGQVIHNSQTFSG